MVSNGASKETLGPGDRGKTGTYRRLTTPTMQATYVLDRHRPGIDALRKVILDCSVAGLGRYSHDSECGQPRNAN